MPDIAPVAVLPMSKPIIRRNMAACIMLDSIFSFGWTEVMMAMIPLLAFLNATNTQIGLITGATFAAIPGILLSPWVTRHFRIKKWYLFGTNVPYLLPVGLCGLGVLMSQGSGFEDSFLVNFILVMMLISQFFGGFVELPHQEYIAACVPMSHRGRLTGFSNSAAGLVSIGSSLIGAWILTTFEKPMSFGILLVFAWAVCQTGYVSCLFAREQPTPVELSPPPWSKRMIFALLDDKSYLRALLVTFLFYGVLMQVGTFVSVYGFRVLGMPAEAAAYLAITANIARIGFVWLIGILVDRNTPRRALPYFFILSSVALLPVICYKDPVSVYLFAFIGTLATAGAISALNPIMFGIPKPENRAGHFTAKNIAVNLAFAIGPISLGLLCDAASYQPVFIGIAIFSFALFPFSKWILSTLSDSPKSYS